MEDYEKLLQYNLFTYCWNNPIKISDTLGTSPANIIGGIVSGATGAALGYLLANNSEQIITTPGHPFYVINKAGKIITETYYRTK